jgi:hypothetical protein
VSCRRQVAALVRVFVSGGIRACAGSARAGLLLTVRCSEISRQDAGDTGRPRRRRLDGPARPRSARSKAPASPRTRRPTHRNASLTRSQQRRQRLARPIKASQPDEFLTTKQLGERP